MAFGAVRVPVPAFGPVIQAGRLGELSTYGGMPLFLALESGGELLHEQAPAISTPFRTAFHALAPRQALQKLL